MTAKISSLPNKWSLAKFVSIRPRQVLVFANAAMMTTLKSSILKTMKIDRQTNVRQMEYNEDQSPTQEEFLAYQEMVKKLFDKIHDPEYLDAIEKLNQIISKQNPYLN